MAQVKRNEAESRYEIEADGGVVGFADYAVDGSVLTAVRVVVDEAHQGQGYAGQLATTLLDDAKEAGQSVLPRCPYVSSFIKKNDEYLDLVPAEQRGEFGL